jgi:SET domain-containing protein
MASSQPKRVSANAAAGKAARSNGAAASRPYVVRRSPVHGRGVFATQPIRKGTRIIEYKGKRVDWDWASAAYAPVEGQPTHTFLFELDDGRVIDANQGGNAARWINHSCSPNCQAIEEDGRVYIEALRSIRTGEELGYDYRIQIEERLTPAEKKRWPCYCGSRKCRGTLLAPKRR